MISMFASKIFVLVAVSLCAFGEPLVESPVGKISGLVQKIENVNVESFLGIPYGKPPVGDLRFELPQPFGPVGDYEATKFGPSCTQPAMTPHQMFQLKSQSEDCLYLNVFRREGTRESDSKAVIILIHGGGFSMSSASDSEHNMAPLAALGDVITVSLNYRLGIMGFSDFRGLAPGNRGFYDQRLALEWVQNNIRSFGGNPNKVTLMGVSAGSISISAHIVSPLNRNKNLFQSVVMDAGVMTDRITELPENSFNRVKQIAKASECPSEGSEMLQCLKNVDAKKLNDFSFDPENHSSILTFAPTIDGVFIPKDIMKEIEEHGNEIKQLRMIIGCAKDEGSIFSSYYMDGRSFPDLQSADEFMEWLKKLTQAGNMPLFLENNEKLRKDLITTYYEAYPHPFYGASRFMSDVFFVCPTNRFVETFAKFNNEIYLYHFERTLKGTYSMLDPKIFGAFHFSPFLHFSGSHLGSQNVVVDEEDRRFFLDSIEMISNFASSDTPPQIRGIQWPNFASGEGILYFMEQPAVHKELTYEDNCRRFSWKGNGQTKDEL